MPYLINKIYFWYSLLYLIGRTCVVFLCAGSIHDVSRRPIEYIRTVPTCEWCTELERFAEQVSTEKIALSGMKFFLMTRKLLFGVSWNIFLIKSQWICIQWIVEFIYYFQMAGTVVTYELVLLQFDEGSKDVGVVNICDRND